MTFAMGILAATAGTAWADGDANVGRMVFNVCKECHTADAETNSIGPHLKGLIGRKVASVGGYEYSDSMIEFAAANPVWDDALFLEYIKNPMASVLMSKMAFPGLMKEDLRANILAYLKTKM